MAELWFEYCVLVLLFASGTLMKATVKAEDSCYQDLGVCDADCLPRCSQAHPGGHGSCVGAEVCRCYFSCKTCKTSLGIWGTACDTNQCNAQCLDKYSPLGIQGYCYPGGDPYTMCFCEYKC